MASHGLIVNLTRKSVCICAVHSSGLCRILLGSQGFLFKCLKHGSPQTAPNCFGDETRKCMRHLRYLTWKCYQSQRLTNQKWGVALPRKWPDVLQHSILASLLGGWSPEKLLGHSSQIGEERLMNDDNRLNARLYEPGCWLNMIWYVDKDDNE